MREETTVFNTRTLWDYWDQPLNHQEAPRFVTKNHKTGTHVYHETHPDIVQFAWKELCMMICPGGSDGMDAMNRAIDAGPDKRPTLAVIELMKEAVRKGVFMKVVTMGYYFSPRQTSLVEARYAALTEWCGEVFPG